MASCDSSVFGTKPRAPLPATHPASSAPSRLEVSTTAGGRRLAADRGVDLPTVVCGWEPLVAQGWSEGFDAVFCVGNSLTHAPQHAARRTALGKWLQRFARAVYWS